VIEMAYSLDLRKKVIDYRKTHTLQQTHEVFKISISTILDWETLLEKTGSLKKRVLNRSHKKIDPIALSEYILEFPDAYLHEIAKHFGCTATAVHYALENQSITLKKLKFVIVRQIKKNEKLSKKLWRN
jgi:transposase